jgi:ferric-dicitrate binding protein FerR (iron transport regulator)
MIRFRPRSDHSSCPAGWEITQALSQPETAGDVVRHLRDCSTCAQLAAELRAVVSAAAELPPVAPMSQAARERISHALTIADAETRPPLPRQRRFRLSWAFAGGLACAALVLSGSFLLHRHATPGVARRSGEAVDIADKPRSLARVRAYGDARLRRVSGPPDETVRVESGRVAFEVAHLTSEQRFRVMTGDGEVEVRGTRFEVEAHADALWAVAVTEGKVDVRVGDMGLRLQAGDEWQRQQPSSLAGKAGLAGETSSPSTNPAAVPAAPPGHEPQARPRVVASAGQSDQVKQSPEASSRESFDLAWSHLRHGQWDEAIRSFAAVAVEARDRALEEDALYWQAVATARAGRAQEASRLFEAFLQRFVTGAHAGAATLALAWLHFDAGKTEAARILFERAARDSSAKVREGAHQGLRRLHSRQIAEGISRSGHQ